MNVQEIGQKNKLRPVTIGGGRVIIDVYDNKKKICNLRPPLATIRHNSLAVHYAFFAFWFFFLMGDYCK
jgi:hypothetical protein